MLRRSVRVLAPAGAVLLSVALATSASAASATVSVTDTQRLADRSSVQVTVDVTCDAPAGATSTVSTTVWQGRSSQSNKYLEAAGSTEVVCDGVLRSYSYTATVTPPFAGKSFTLGKAFTESGVQYCVRIDPTTTQCTPIDPLVRQTVHLHR